jgi:hypothetical protein
VGSNHYILAVNSSFAIYSKSGAQLAAFTEDSLWSGSNAGPCDGNSQGDPVVLYDAIADRWVLTNFAFAIVSGNPVSPFYECIAVSRSGDPISGGWYLYGIRTDTGSAGQPPAQTFNDYPKFGIWNDCLYYSANAFSMPSESPAGVEYGTFSRSDMYAGRALTSSLGYLSSSNNFTMIPGNLSAPGTNGLPPSGRPNFYVQESVTSFGFLVRTFTPGADCGGGGTLSAPTTISHPSYTVPDGAIVPQPASGGLSVRLDALGDRLMQKVQYRKVGNSESLWVAHTFRSSSNGPTGVHWAQINVTGGTISTTLVQQQLFNPGDGLYRWMGSLAADKDGNMALGYSTSNGSSPNFPGIAYAGRLAGDTLGALPQAEMQLVAGSGSQANTCGGSPCDRWGDYSSMSVDPVDGCTFWYTNEYYTSQSNGSTGNWATRIGAFAFPGCLPFGSAPSVRVYIAGVLQASYPSSSGTSAEHSYPNVQNGPVEVTGPANLLPSERGIFGPYHTFNEVMGFPNNQLTNHYWFPWYDNASMITWVLVGNASSSQTAHVTIKIGSSTLGSYSIPPLGNVTPTFNVAPSGPVEVLSDIPVFTSERALTGWPSGAQSFDEVLGFPANQLTNHYWFTWYDDKDMQTQIMLGNPSGNRTAHVTIRIAGVKKGTYNVPPRSTIAKEYPLLQNGPVEVSSDINIFTSERSLFGAAPNQTYNEVMGYAHNQLTNYYWFPRYDNVSMIHWVLVGNPSATTSAHVTIHIAGAVVGAYTIAPRGNVTPTFNVPAGGPVEVTSDINVFTSERALSGYPGTAPSFNEILGVADSKLTSDYWFTWYDDKDMSTQLMIAIP